MDKKQKNYPLYYLETIAKMNDIYTRNQILSSFIIACNHFQVNLIELGDLQALPPWSKFFLSYKHKTCQAELEPFQPTQPEELVP